MYWGKLEHSFRGNIDTIWSLDICIEKGLIASGSWDKSARLWKIE